MDAKGIATLLGNNMAAHQDKLQVNKQGAQGLQDALTEGAHALTTSRESQGKDASALLEHWNSETADHFHSRSNTLGQEMHTVSAAGTSAASLVEGLTQSVVTAHGATQSLIDEYTGKATTILAAAQATQGAGGATSVLSAFAKVIDLANSYGKATGQVLAAADGTVKNATGQLKALTEQLRGDKIAMPKVATTGDKGGGTGTHGKPGKPPKTHPDKHGGTTQHGNQGHDQHHPGKPPHPGDSTKTSSSANSKVASKIITAARHELGYHETGDNIDKFGPPGAPWCSYFATAMWRKAGVNIPQYGFTGDVYKWGEAHGLAYSASHLNQVRPGDVLLFGTGPDSTSSSLHIGIVEAVHGNTVTTIEGNEGNAVRTETHPLSSSIFYGGVHP